MENIKLEEGILSDIIKARASQIKTISQNLNRISSSPPKGLPKSTFYRYVMDNRTNLDYSLNRDYLKDTPLDNYYKSSIMLNVITRIKTWDNLTDSNKLLTIYQLSIYFRVAKFMVSIQNQGIDQEVRMTYNPMFYRLLNLNSIELDEKDYQKLVVIILRIMRLDME